MTHNGSLLSTGKDTLERDPDRDHGGVSQCNRAKPRLSESVTLSHLQNPDGYLLEGAATSRLLETLAQSEVRAGCS